MLDDCASRIPGVVKEIEESLPSGFPEKIARPILEGLSGSERRIRAT